VIGTDTGAARLRVLEREPRIPIIHHADERGVWATRGRQILFRAEGGGSWRSVGRFPRRPLDPLGVARTASRLLRLDRATVHATSGGVLLGIRGGVVHRFEDGRADPLGGIQGNCLMNRAIAETCAGVLFFGEYLIDARRPIRIWRVPPDLSRMEPVYEFSAPTIRHVHGIHPDPFQPGRLWFTTGDFDGECFVGFTDDGFAHVELLGDGGQNWRTVGLLFEPDRLVWLTDSELARNRVVSMDRRTASLHFHGELSSSTWYTAKTTDGVHLATTTVEPGPSILARHAFVLDSRDALCWREAAAFEKDRLPMPWFKFGTLSLPSGRFSSGRFWLSGEGLRGLDGASLLCALEPAGEGA
jgi:hypothetical protein